MIDKEKIKEEIEKYAKEEALKSNGSEFYGGRVSMCTKILSFIDSLPEEPVSEDLEEDSSFEKLLQEIYIKYNKQISIEKLLDIASHFAEWQKQQMMKNVVDGEVVYQIGSAEIAPTDIRYKVVSDRVYIPNVKLGDKVKIIIVKEEQQCVRLQKNGEILNNLRENIK